MSKSRFRYVLEPVLLTRRWALAELMAQLTEHQAQMAAQGSQIAAVQERYALASADWQNDYAGASHTVARFVLNARYLDDLATQRRQLELRMATLAAARADIIVRVAQAQRSLEAAEKHRGQMKERFEMERASAEFKLADDQWNALQTGAASHVNQH